MDPEIEEIIKKQMGKLPIEVRKLFTDPGLNDKILNIGKKNRLNTEELGILQTEINLVILGLVHPDNFPDELEENLKIDDLKLDNVINDIKEQIFRNIRENLQEAYEKTGEDLDDKVNTKGENANWEQNLDFILSGGDYSAFIEERDTPTPVTPPTLADIKANTQKTNPPTSTSKMTDIKSKFVI